MKYSYNVSNRRYIGCKSKLLDNIWDVAKTYDFGSKPIMADIFAGTGVVGGLFANKGYKVIFNDTLYSNYVAYNAFFGTGVIDNKKIEKLIFDFNAINSNLLEENYFSQTYGNKYFSKNDAKKIGYIRDKIEELKKSLSEREYFYLITSLMYTADRIANTVGHFESFLKHTPKEHGVILKPLIINNNSFENEIYKEDANNLVKHIRCDIAYIDPPYNARQYVNFYHVLENLAAWQHPTEFEGNSMKFKRNHLKSDYCRKKAPELFEDLIRNLKAKLIIVSYNNTYKAGSISSINTITEDQLMKTLTAKGKVKKINIDYNPFNAGKTELTAHMEYLFICEVGEK